MYALVKKSTTLPNGQRRLWLSYILLAIAEECFSEPFFIRRLGIALSNDGTEAPVHPLLIMENSLEAVNEDITNRMMVA